MAFLTNPQIDDYSMPFSSPAEQNTIAIRWLSHHKVVNMTKALQEFDDFRERRGPFAKEAVIWQAREKISLFWKFAMHEAPHLAPLALRLAHTPATTVPAERSFSNLKIIHTIIRNRLSKPRVKKLLYIYMNSRVLERLDTGRASAEALNDELLLEVEREILELGGLQVDGTVDVPHIE